MYVLQHADRPELYAGLPANPKVSPVVEVWKGAMKPLGLAAIGLALVGAFFHYVTTTPIEVSEEDEDQARRLKRETRGAAERSA